MRKNLVNAKDELVDLLFSAIQEEHRPVNGHYLSEVTKEHRKSIHMNPVEISHFMKRFVTGVNFDNKVVEIERKQGNNGSNIYKMVMLNGAS
jgi:hypothetical protein